MRISDWQALDAAGREAILARPRTGRDDELRRGVQRAIDQVRADGDWALRALTRRFDGVELDALRADADEIAAARDGLDADLLAAIDRAIETLEAFHEAQRPQRLRVETAPGVICERRPRPIPRVGLYVPAGSAPLPSTALMLGVPARLAGCSEVVLCTPPRPDGRADPTVLAAADRLGIDRVFKLGGAQAIAAMAFGTESVPKVDKIFGPGSARVTEAKLLVAQDPVGAAYDMPAGPSEVMVVADASARADFVAADLLSQAEHGEDSQVLLVTDDAALAQRCLDAVEWQLVDLPRAAVARESLRHGCAIVTADIDQAMAVANRYAPEHLILQLADADTRAEAVECAGSVFLGPWSPEAMGDYCSGTNHVLPTYGFARAFSGLSLESFMTQITFQRLSADGLAELGPTAERLADAEGLEAHRRAVALRRAALSEEGTSA